MVLQLYAKHWQKLTKKEILPDGMLSVYGQEVAVIYFRAGYTPVDYPSESVSDQFVFAAHS
ncbi:hypothetical protein TSUD_144850 [Trifolium subterraneum]|uniref:Glutathione synthase substrate-binding domain-containing protein n=1 Tax=Trifolium subterraneum TaxID=3900 RepID=A0A2Z6P7H4_TRISU|nr:hypothetical protein TSUD_144850 [Trifolium subterraneum]